MKRPQPLLMSRRAALRSAGAGFGYLALAGPLGQNALRAGPSPVAPLAPKAPHFRPRARRIIFIFMEGAMSQHDTFEYKPVLQANAGKTAPAGGRLPA